MGELLPFYEVLWDDLEPLCLQGSPGHMCEFDDHLPEQLGHSMSKRPCSSTGEDYEPRYVRLHACRQSDVVNRFQYPQGHAGDSPHGQSALLSAIRNIFAQSQFTLSLSPSQSISAEFYLEGYTHSALCLCLLCLLDRWGAGGHGTMNRWAAPRTIDATIA
jgi:hypothetical protein